MRLLRVVASVTKMYRQVRDLLKDAGFEYVRSGKGSHEMWEHPVSKISVSLPTTLDSWGTADAILKKAGLPPIWGGRGGRDRGGDRVQSREVDDLDSLLEESEYLWGLYESGDFPKAGFKLVLEEGEFESLVGRRMSKKDVVFVVLGGGGLRVKFRGESIGGVESEGGLFEAVYEFFEDMVGGDRASVSGVLDRRVRHASSLMGSIGLGRF